MTDVRPTTIVEVALNGAVAKAANPNVPRTPAEISHDALACIAAGASIVHNHNDESVVSGPPEHDWRPYAMAWRTVLAAEPDALLYPTMPGWRPETTIEQRYSHVVALAKEGVLGTPVIDLGGFNVGRSGPDGVPVPTDDMYVNTYRDMDYMFRTCQQIGLPVSLAVFEPGHLRAGLAYLKAGWVPAGSMIKLFFDATEMGAPGRGLSPTTRALDAYLEMLAGFVIPWMAVVTSCPVNDVPFLHAVLDRGGHLSVGIERTGGIGTATNVELVEEAVQVCAEVGRPAASCAQARELLGVPRLVDSGRSAP
ncbi:3-keto-5-aminohexanoate cleavage protein [Mycolicibacterium hodleri]|uniref:3-keto-5-aminohexanoate cleavage protein n=1 Tax=Mycolicibacterium hodleri TaxID=49897 RepID=A0A502E673_9MYCO|nr:3-keto-5-aminohexanoate cleavage protein [Mycolicibacterium hodleri]TPG32459.1 3-keto-5-aminohexanoate cleavage protein [Mycolicibacterium hodleri]